MSNVIPIQTNTPEDWQRARLLGLGGSEVGAIAGVNRWLSPFDVFAQKTGLMPPPEETPAMRLGKALEPSLATLYSEETGKVLITSPLLQRPDNPIVIGSPDRLVQGEPLGVELKTAGFRMAPEWGEGPDEVPMSYLVQSAWYMALLDYPAWDLAVLIAGDDFRLYHLKRDLELEGYLLDIAQKFWTDHIQAQIPPPMQYTERTSEWLKARYPTHNQTMLAASAEADKWARVYAEAKARRDVAEKELQDAQINLENMIGDALGIEGETWRATHKKTASNGTDYKALIAELKVPQETLKRFARDGYRKFHFSQKE